MPVRALHSTFLFNQKQQRRVADGGEEFLSVIKKKGRMAAQPNFFQMPSHDGSKMPSEQLECVDIEVFLSPMGSSISRFHDNL